MDYEELAQLLSEASSLDASAPHSPLHLYDSSRGAVARERSQRSQRSQRPFSQQQRLLSTLDDDSLVGLVNTFDRPTQRARLRRPAALASDAAGVGDEPCIVTSSPEASPPIVPSTPDASSQLSASEPSSTRSLSGSPSAPRAAPLNFGDYAQYFSDKSAHQRSRDEYMKKLYQDALNDGREYPPIFKDCVVYINGRTFPDRLQLHQMIIIHGGSFKHFLSGKKSVTHIIASNLTAKKRIEFQNYKVVTPAWVTESIAASKRLPWQDYALITGEYGQQKLQMARASASAAGAPAAPAPLLQPVDTFDADSLDCKQPGFLQSFFAKSRLHQLSAWKADLRALFCGKYVEGAQLQPPPMGARLAIFHVDFDCFFATVSALSDARYDLSRDPLAVAHGTNSSEIASCNYVARSFGVKNGMWVRSARRLCPDLICLPYNFEQYEVNSKLLYQILAGSGFFQMILPISIDEAICVKYLDGPSDDDATVHQQCEAITHQIRRDVYDATNGCTVSIGCGSSLVLARLALKKAKPDGHCVMVSRAQDSIDNFIEEFPLRDLPGIGASIVEKVQQHILSKQTAEPTIGDLKHNSSLPLLASKLGTKTGHKLHLFLSGKDDEENSRVLRDPLDYFARKSISVDINYAIRFDTIHQIDEFIDRICDHLTTKLKELDMVTPQVTLKVMRRCEHAPIEPAKYLGSGECDAFSRSSRFGVPTCEVGLISTEVKSSFRMLGCPPKDLRGIAVQLNKLEKAPDKVRQLRLPFREQDASSIGSRFPALNANAFHSLPGALKEDVRTELLKRKINLPPSPPSKRSASNSPVKDYWGRHGKRAEILKQEMPSTLDEDFMRHLPTQIQREIKWDHAIVKKASSSVRKRLGQKETGMLNSFKHRPTKPEVVRFQTLERPLEISRLIKSWIDDTIDNGPHIDDLNLFDKYLTKLAAKGKTHHILKIARTMSSHLEYHSSFTPSNPQGRQEWEEYLLIRMIPTLTASAAKSDKGVQVTFEL
ncbi:LAQU0S01e15258g1_1 [Lachancea quebecensis]|uniref:DNA repair protein REV1 n=1 Tax=Lachancea quebecensis TaxID=1654605 RepID=A0A0N7MKZ0_9SACH|nr:LAQU0S01e15258g1_1 [Lachancea quebecensis]